MISLHCRDRYHAPKLSMVNQLTQRGGNSCCLLTLNWLKSRYLKKENDANRMSAKRQKRTSRYLFDYFVGGDDQAGRWRHTKGSSSFEIEGCLVLRRSLHREVGRLGTAKDLIDV